MPVCIGMCIQIEVEYLFGNVEERKIKRKMNRKIFVFYLFSLCCIFRFVSYIFYFLFFSSLSLIYTICTKILFILALLIAQKRLVWRNYIYKYMLRLPLYGKNEEKEFCTIKVFVLCTLHVLHANLSILHSFSAQIE